MLMFTLAISCLTTSNLPWFLDLTFQVPMQHYSLQHQTWLLSSVASTTGCFFYFGSVSSFFLELFLHWSPVAYRAPSNLESSSFSRLLISWLQSPSAVILEPKKLKSATVSTVFPSTCHEVMGLDVMILVFWMLSFKPNFHSSLSLSSQSSLVFHFLP